MDLRRRRSQSKGREPTADERLDALLEEARASEKPKEPTRRTQSLEPSRMLTPSLRKTSSALTAGASRERSAPEEVRAIENRDREGSRQPQGPPVSFLPVVPPFFFHEYGRRVGMVPRSSLKEGKNSQIQMVEKGTKTNQQQKPKQPQTRPHRPNLHHLVVFPLR